jgi:hypothetical protein
LIKVLGTEFDGVLGCDYFSSYRSYMDQFDVTIQVAVHRDSYVRFARTATATNEERLALHRAVPHLYSLRAA